MIQNDIAKTVKQLPVSQYDFMFTPFGSLVICVKLVLTQNKPEGKR